MDHDSLSWWLLRWRPAECLLLQFSFQVNLLSGSVCIYFSSIIKLSLSLCTFQCYLCTRVDSCDGGCWSNSYRCEPDPVPLMFLLLSPSRRNQQISFLLLLCSKTWFVSSHCRTETMSCHLQEAMTSLIGVFHSYSGREGDKYKLNKGELKSLLKEQLADLMSVSICLILAVWTKDAAVDSGNNLFSFLLIVLTFL